MWKNFSLAQQVAQMVVVRASGHLFDEQRRYPFVEATLAQLEYWLKDLAIGGVIFVGGSAPELAIRTNLLQSWAKFPLLMAADIEEGVGQRFSGASWFPAPMALGEISRQDLPKSLIYARQMGEIIARESLAVGLNWILAPVVDVNNNPDNPVINIRSFSADFEIVSELATSFINGCQNYPVLTTAKHFPGHGDTAIDSHFTLPILPHGEARLQAIELPPFVRAIAAGVDSVMTAHLLVPIWDDQYPATLSKPILTGQLREKLGFQGLIVTDALVMGAIAHQYTLSEASILAVEAGADILLMPEDPEVVIDAVVKAVESGRISSDRIHQSLDRIWQAKTKVCQPTILDKMPINPSIFINNPLSLVEAKSPIMIQEILEKSSKKGGNLPWVISPDQQEIINVVLVDDLFNCIYLGNHTPALTIPKKLGFKHQLIDCSNGEAIALQSIPTLLQVFIRGNPFGTTAKLTNLALNLIKQLCTNNLLKALVVYGSPYALEKFTLELPANLPYVFVYGQFPAAQAIGLETLFGSLVNQKAGFSQFE